MDRKKKDKKRGPKQYNTPFDEEAKGDRNDDRKEYQKK
jgi:hypothetical protein